VTQNAGPATTTVHAAGTVTNTDAPPGDPDVTILDGTATVQAAFTSAGGIPTSLDMWASGSVSRTSTKAYGGCAVFSNVGGAMTFQLTTPVPGYLTIGQTAAGSAPSAAFNLGASSPDSPPYHVEVDGRGGTTSATRRAYLPAGDYVGRATAGFTVIGNRSVSGPFSVSIHVAFSPLGSQTEVQTGKGGRYVSLSPAARSCAGHLVTAAVTPRRKAAKKLKSLMAYVGSTKVLTDRHVARAEVYQLPVADQAPAEVRFVVTLRPPRHKKRGKPESVETSASFEACS